MSAIEFIQRLFRDLTPQRKAGVTGGGLGSPKAKPPDDSEINKGTVPSTRLQKAIKLKDYAIENNLFVPDNILETLNNITEEKAQSSTDLDKAIRDLTRITHPTTLETIQFANSLAESSKGKPRPWPWVVGVIVALVIAIVSDAYVSQSPQVTSSPGNSAQSPQVTPPGNSAQSPQVTPDLNQIFGKMGFTVAQSFLAVSLGLMGTLVYMIFNLIGIMSEKAFDRQDSYTNWLRIALGPVLGWVLFFGLKSIGTVENNDTWAVLLIPFLAGFSVRLVVGVITQALSAIELVLGIGGKDTQLLQRRRGR